MCKFTDLIIGERVNFSADCCFCEICENTVDFHNVPAIWKGHIEGHDTFEFITPQTCQYCGAKQLGWRKICDDNDSFIDLDIDLDKPVHKSDFVPIEVNWNKYLVPVAPDIDMDLFKRYN